MKSKKINVQNVLNYIFSNMSAMDGINHMIEYAKYAVIRPFSNGTTDHAVAKLSRCAGSW